MLPLSSVAGPLYHQGSGRRSTRNTHTRLERRVHYRHRLRLLFPAMAAIVPDLFSREGPDVVHGLIFPNDEACHRTICALAAQALLARDCV
jgi:hypothetical protein